ncbi:hypothetical protein [Paucihalobacter sp.]|uniref:hypothetical protein n=1 Tax=Paucihalobacter sp. TaxID=2850405 RepID=UPI002FE39976
MTLIVLVVIAVWFICGFLINYYFETNDTHAQKKGFHMATALHIFINIIAFITILALLYG